MSELLTIGAPVHVQLGDTADAPPAQDGVIVEVDTSDPEMPYQVDLGGRLVWCCPDEVSAK